MNMWSAILWIARKDLYSEWKTRQMMSTMLIFSGLVIVIFSFAFDPANQSMKAIMPGVLWVTIVFSGILGLNRSFIAEYKNENLSGMMVSPVDPSAIYLGKMIANFIIAVVVEVIAIPLLFILFDFRWMGSLPYFISIILLGTFGFISIGTFLAALSANSRSSEMLLPVILFPIVTPILIGAVQATKIILTNMEKLPTAISWIELITGYDAIFFVLCFLLFEYVLEV
jgi:heme exporter protein B